MKNILIFAGLAGIAAAIAIYFVTEDIKEETRYVSESDREAYDLMEHTGMPHTIAPRGFHSMN